MSFNRLKYDLCSYKADLSQIVGPLEYLLDPIKYENCNKCRHQLGLVGGSAVSHIQGNIVDLENDLRNQTRPNSRCPIKKYHKPNGNVIHLPANLSSGPRDIDITPLHLPPCQMIRYPPTPMPQEPQFYKCYTN